MRDSVIYQEIFEEGFEAGRLEVLEEARRVGRVNKARAMILRGGNRRFGEADPAVRARLERIPQLETLESLIDRLLDGTASSWDEFLSVIP